MVSLSASGYICQSCRSTNLGCYKDGERLVNHTLWLINECLRDSLLAETIADTNQQQYGCTNYMFFLNKWLLISHHCDTTIQLPIGILVTIVMNLC